MTTLNRGDRQAGGVMAAAVILLAGLAAVTGLTVLSVKRSLNATTQQRAHAQAVSAAESGLIVASKKLRDLRAANPNSTFTPVLADPSQWNTVYGAGRASGPLSEYPFGERQLGYDIEYRNNAGDTGGATEDKDMTIIIVVTGCTGANVITSGGVNKACANPSGAVARIEVEVAVVGTGSGGLIGGYAQQNQNELGTATLSTNITATGQVTIKLPGT